MVHNYDVGTRAWQPDPTEGWIASEVVQKTVQEDKVQLVFELESGEVIRRSQAVPRTSADLISHSDKNFRDDYSGSNLGQQ